MFTTEIKKERAVLVSVDIGEFDVEESLAELEELAESAGAEVFAKAVQKLQSINAATCIGKGRLSEITELCKANEVDLLIFDVELSGTQTRNIERETGVRVIDRTTLILDIFAMRAKSREGTLQVMLAQLKYKLPRLVGSGVDMSRQGGGIGMRQGAGETKLELDRRHIRRRITDVSHELEELSKRRKQQRGRRQKRNIPTVCIVGYTNVGKSTLLNALTDSDVLSEDKLFATLDPSARELKLENGTSVMLVDTVGFIRRLPHNLIEAFKSTLEEAVFADVILNVCDISSDMWQEQLSVTQKLLAELSCEGKIITVLNKCDKTEGRVQASANEDTVAVSAFTGYGFNSLLEAISKALPMRHRRLSLTIPYNEGQLLAKLADGIVYSQEYTQQGVLIDCEVDMKILNNVEKYIN